MMQSDRWSAKVLPKKQKKQSATRIDSKGRKRMCFLKMSASSRTGDDGDVVCGGLAICWMLSSCWDCSLILGPELWNNPPPPAAPLSPSPSVCPEDRHPDSTRSHYLPSYIYYNNNNNKSRNMIIMILIATVTNHSCFWFFFAQLDVLLAVKIKSVTRHTMYFLKSHNCCFSTIIRYCCYLPRPIYVKLYKIRIQRNIRLSRVSVVL